MRVEYVHIKTSEEIWSTDMEEPIIRDMSVPGVKDAVLFGDDGYWVRKVVWYPKENKVIVYVSE